MSILTNLNRIVIIGAGPAGISAALGLLEGRQNVLLIDSRGEIGGQLHQIPSPITNWAGGYFENGKAAAESLKIGLGKAMEDAANEDSRLEIRLGSMVKRIKSVPPELKFELELEGGEKLLAETLVIAPGYRERPHALEGKYRGENPFIIHHTSLREESLTDHTDDKPIAIVGGGDSALLKALKLEKDLENIPKNDSGKEIYIIHRGASLRARPDVIAKLHKSKRCRLILDSEVTALTEEASGCRITVQNNKNKDQQELSVCYMLVKIGYLPNTEFLQGFIRLEKDGHIKVDSDLHPYDVQGKLLANVYVVGDVLAGTTPRLATASGQGMHAASKIMHAASKIMHAASKI